MAGVVTPSLALRLRLDASSSTARDRSRQEQGDTDMQTEPGRMNVQLLGPFAAWMGQRGVTPSAAKQRQILALLALNAGRVVTVSTLVEELWGDHPPRSSG